MAGTLIGRLLIGTFLDTKGIDEGSRKAKAKISGFQKYSQAAGRSITSAFAGIGAGLAIGTVLINAGRTVVEFDTKVANLAATAGKSRSQMGALVKNAQDVGAVSAFTASQVLDLQTELAKLGNSETDIISMTKSVGDFSIAVGTSAAEAATFVGGTLKSFGIAASQTESVVSSLAVATTKSALDFNKLNVALPIVGTAADQMGFSLEKTTSLLGVLADRNIDASTAGTALRNIFLDLKEKGLTYDEAMFKINNSTDKLNTANELFGKRGAVVATVLAESGDAAKTLEESITGVDGALKQMTDTRLDTVQGKVTLLSSAWEGLILTVDSGGGVLSNAFSGAVGGLTSFLSGLTELNQLDPAKEYKRESEELATLLTALVNNSDSLAVKNGIIKKLNDKYPEYIKNIDLENASIKDVNIALGDYQKLNDNRLRGLVFDKKKQDLLERQRDLENTLVDLAIQKEKTQRQIDNGDIFTGSILANEAAIKIYRKELAGVETDLENLITAENKASAATKRRGEGSAVLLNTKPVIIEEIIAGTKPVIAYSEAIKELEAQVINLSEAYVRGGSNNKNIIDSITSKQAKIISLNSDLEKSVALVNKLERGNQTISAPASIGSVGLPSSVNPQSFKNTQNVELSASFLKKAKEDTEAVTIANQALNDSYIALGQGIADGLEAGGNSFAEFAQSALASIQKVIGGLIKLFVAKALASSLGAGPLGLLAAGAIGSLAAGIFNTAINSLKVPKLAQGGVIDKPTYALLGEYPGASTNPEIAAPEDKLTRIFRNELGRNGGGGGQMFSVTKGEDIYQSQDRYNYKLARTG